MSSPDDPSPPAEEADEEAVLRFQSLRVRRFHDIQHELDVDLCDDVNVIFGSNASGKTTLAHAIRALLWPKQVDNHRPLVTAQFELDDASWQVELDGESCTYLKARSPANPPSLPPATHARRYHLYLHDFLSGEDGDRDFARLILQEAQGGIDVEGAAEALGFEVPTRRKSKKAKAVEDLRAEVRAAKTEQEDLREKEKKLDSLRDQLTAARAAAERVTALEQAIEVAQARAAYEEAEAQLNSFAEVLKEIRGDEIERLESLQNQIRTAERNAEEAKADLKEGQETIEDSRIPNEGVSGGHLEELRTVTTTLQEQERTVREIRSEVEAAEQKEEAAWDRLAAGRDRETAAAIDLPKVQEIESHVQAVEEIQGTQTALETAEEMFADEETDGSVEGLRDGLRQLHRWLQAPIPRDRDGRGPWDFVVLGTALLVAAAGILLVVTGTETVFWLGPVLLLLGVLIVLAERWRQPGDSPQGRDRRAHHAEEFERLNLDTPAAWSREAVEQHADQLLARLREAAVALEKQETWERLRPRLKEVEETAAELEAERQRLADRLGVDPDVSSRSLEWLVDRLSQWQTAYDDLEGTKTALAEAKEEASACRARLNDELSTYDLGPVENAGEAQGDLKTLQSAWEEFREAQRMVERAKERQSEAEEGLEDAEENLSSLYERLGLEVGEEEALRELVEQHEAYEEAVDAEQTARATLETERRQLGRCEGHEPWMMEAAEDDLSRELKRAQSKAEKEDQYLDQLKQIEYDIDAALEGGTLEHRRAEYRRARNQLAQDRDRDYDRAVGHVVADLVQEETRDQGLPPVFYRARDLFAEITNDRYGLTLDRANGRFRAYDHVYDRSFSLNALSSGTKVQLLLSVRVAFVETQEHGGRVPLVLDETLANSDAERAQAIIDAVRTICRRGRQVFYLTAQADEVNKWKGALEEDESVEHNVVSLSDFDQRERSSIEDGLSVPARQAPIDLPNSETTDHEALRDVLSVPQWTPRHVVNQLHLWYLIETIPSLLALIEAGTRTWGQLHFQYQRGGLAATALGENDFRHVRALAQAVESWREAWWVGRGRPVDRTALEATDAVTDTFIDGVSELAHELEGDAEALLRIIRNRVDERVSGFRSAKADALEAYLRKNDFLDLRDRHSPEEMWQYLLADLANARQDDLVALDDLERLFDRFRVETPSPSS